MRTSNGLGNGKHHVTVCQHFFRDKNQNLKKLYKKYTISSDKALFLFFQSKTNLIQ